MARYRRGRGTRAAGSSVPYQYKLLATVIAAVLVIGLDRLGCFGYQGDAVATHDAAAVPQETFVVSKIVDGDTIHVRKGKEESIVRLLGIDCPEMNYGKPDGPDHGAAEATAYLTSRINRKNVTLKLNTPNERDRYDRLLAYVYMDGTTNINLEMVQNGHAYADRRHDHAMRAQFEQAELQAERKKTGLWNGLKRNQMPRWRQNMRVPTAN